MAFSTTAFVPVRTQVFSRFSSVCCRSRSRISATWSSWPSSLGFQTVSNIDNVRVSGRPISWRVCDVASLVMSMKVSRRPERFTRVSPPAALIKFCEISAVNSSTSCRCCRRISSMRGLCVPSAVAEKRSLTYAVSGLADRPASKSICRVTCSARIKAFMRSTLFSGNMACITARIMRRDTWSRPEALVPVSVLLCRPWLAPSKLPSAQLWTRFCSSLSMVSWSCMMDGCTAPASIKSNISKSGSSL
mmetsp:Transcript_57041/g.133799  ORF Transcript_57041/g.133799 Transcript_57041/m.133799 type:complete len:247 (-) Transcript_57041:472-1212(-)